MTTLAAAERASLADLFAELGPDSPTLCEGWTTRDLAAHLVIREGRPDAMPGIVLHPLAGWTERVRAGASRGDYGVLVEQVRSGPPWWSPFRVPGVDATTNAVEYFVHHEDVRRAQPDWEARELPAVVQDELWRRLVAQSRMLFRSAPDGVSLKRPGRSVRPVTSGEAPVTLTGEAAELLLFAFGRTAHAHVDVEGEPEAVARFEAVRLAV